MQNLTPCPHEDFLKLILHNVYATTFTTCMYRVLRSCLGDTTVNKLKLNRRSPVSNYNQQKKIIGKFYQQLSVMCLSLHVGRCFCVEQYVTGGAWVCAQQRMYFVCRWRFMENWVILNWVLPVEGEHKEESGESNRREEVGWRGDTEGIGWRRQREREGGDREQKRLGELR